MFFDLEYLYEPQFFVIMFKVDWAGQTAMKASRHVFD